MTYRVILSRRSRRAVTEHLPEPVAVACWEFLTGALAENPRRVGKALRGELEGRYCARRGEFRIIYRIDDERVIVEVIDIRHRRGGRCSRSGSGRPAIPVRRRATG